MVTRASGAGVDECGESEREAGAAVGEPIEAGAAVAAAEVGPVAAEGVLDEEALLCDWAGTAAEA